MPLCINARLKLHHLLLNLNITGLQFLGMDIVEFHCLLQRKHRSPTDIAFQQFSYLGGTWLLLCFFDPDDAERVEC